jgi:hypothetical protein
LLLRKKLLSTNLFREENASYLFENGRRKDREEVAVCPSSEDMGFISSRRDSTGNQNIGVEDDRHHIRRGSGTALTYPLRGQLRRLLGRLV